jgi:hypothetical protein
MRILFVQGQDFDIGLRLKKLDGGYRAYQHDSHQQNDLRRTGQFTTQSFPELDFPLAHVFFGYRCTRGLRHQLRDIAISFEGMTARGQYFVDWQRIVWSARGGFDPPFRGTRPLFPPDEPNFDIQPRRGIDRRQAEGE